MSEEGPQILNESSEQPCPVCGDPISLGDHLICRVESVKGNRKLEYELRINFLVLLHKAESDLEALSKGEICRLKAHAQFLLTQDDPYEAEQTFEAIHDFAGEKELAKRRKIEWPQGAGFSNLLSFLEDYEGLRDLMNDGEGGDSIDEYSPVFRCFEQPLQDYITKFLEKNRTPIATGIINEGLDLVAIKNLSERFDIAVPIARGGLKQGAIAELWGLPIRIVDISAHNKKIPRGKWVNPVVAEDFAGKRVLLFDKDAVTGASIRKAVKMVEAYGPKSMGVYFAHLIGVHTHTGGLPPGLEIYDPQNAPLENVGDVYIAAHEKFATSYGQLRVVENKYREGLIPAFELSDSAIAYALKEFLDRCLRAFESLNPLLPGIEKVREGILMKLSNIFEEYDVNLKKMVYKIPTVSEGLVRSLGSIKPLPEGYEEELIRARFRKKADIAAKKRGVHNLHVPLNELEAFHTAREAVRDGYDVALIVGPEGFLYEPLFKELGMQTVAVNVPESKAGEMRTLKVFDSLSVLQGKRVLVIEDDVQTGATLQKIIESLRSNKPTFLGLYLGLPKGYQLTGNIPGDFEKVYIAGEGTTPENSASEFHQYLKSKNLKVFKDEEL